MTVPKKKPKIGVLVVAYNAQKTIGSVLERIRPETWERIDEVFIFDDSSKDETSRAATETKGSRSLEKVRVFRNQVNLGYGGNQKRGYRYAIEQGFDIVVLLHGDGQYAPEVMDALLDPVIDGHAEAVFGSRMLRPGGARAGGMPLYKYVGNKVLTGMQNVLMDAGLSEYHSGYRVYDVHALARLPLHLNSNDFHFDNEIIIQFYDAGLRMREVPIPTYYGDEICHVNGMAYAWNVFKGVLRYRAHKAGLAYAPRFDTRAAHRYEFKRGKHSSHGAILAAVERYARELGRPLRILDLGCAAGFLAKHISQAGHSVVGVDLYDSPEAREHCARFLVADLEQGLPPGLEVDGGFDMVIMADVLEHLRVPTRLLLAIRPLLGAGGRIVASSGNVAHAYVRLSLALGRFDYTDRGILDRTHHMLFTLQTFEALLTECGFIIRDRAQTPVPFELIFPDLPLLADALCEVNVLGNKVAPSLLAYQTVLVADMDRRSASTLMRERQIIEPYAEWTAPRAEVAATPHDAAGS